MATGLKFRTHHKIPSYFDILLQLIPPTGMSELQMSHIARNLICGFQVRHEQAEQPQKMVGAPIAPLGECRTLDRKVAGSILSRGTVLCP